MISRHLAQKKRKPDHKMIGLAKKHTKRRMILQKKNDSSKEE
jgi:hypothetical protein